MRIATFNLLHGRSLSDGQVDPDRLVTAVRELDADVLGLQEVDRDQDRSHRLDLTAIAAEAMGATAVRFAPAISGTPGAHWVPAHGDPGRPGPAYGVALLSRLPVRAWHVVTLPALRLRSPVRLPDGRWILASDEPRIAVAAEVAAPAGPVTVTTTHLSFVPGWNALQLRRLLSRLRTLPGPHVLTGDLNIPGPLPRLLARWRCLATERTFPVTEPRWQLDHVLGLGELPAVTAVRAPALALSDHRALVVDLG